MKIRIGMFCALLGYLIASQAVYAQPVSLFGMFQAKNNTHSKIISQLEQELKTLGCIVLREGKSFGGQGNYPLQPSNSFFVLKCEQSFLAQKSALPVIATLNNETHNLVILEGLDSQSNKFESTDTGTNRSYIFKLSDYNNTSPAQRDLDLAQLNISTQSVEHHYMTEALIRVHDAYGMERPDELVIIYYNSANDGQKFRDNNPELMGKISQFNRDHLTQVSYISAESNR